MVSALVNEISTALFADIMIGNSLFGFIAAWLFQKKRLESAIMARMFFDVTVLAMNAFAWLPPA